MVNSWWQSVAGEKLISMRGSPRQKAHTSAILPLRRQIFLPITLLKDAGPPPPYPAVFNTNTVGERQRYEMRSWPQVQNPRGGAWAGTATSPPGPFLSLWGRACFKLQTENKQQNKRNKTSMLFHSGWNSKDKLVSITPYWENHQTFCELTV